MDQNKCNERIYCDPKYIIKNTYVEKKVTYVHPVIHINREHIQYVPRHVYEEKTINEVVDPGYPNCCDNNKKEKKCCNCCRKKRNCWNWF
ncbi:hypothetical protein BK741_32235 [Bacillus thuringiensis serovar iberica]|uniref:Spore coat protein D n=1 Tax=Bacillus thuringiensis serovar iberica TaxID=180866 RepID=A0A9X6LGD7_BACTU|nr:hypothetical protein [Bacillus thuringiensis]MEB9626166.1 hypothetical protein [Bacillus cereus]OUB40123.1 hypothetical protein BK741_32235 [Bacillus thuringiensis serovar iberica]